MFRRITATALCLCAMAGTPAAVAAQDGAGTHTKFEQRYLRLYWSVVRQFNRRAPGRNIVTRGIKTNNGVRKAHIAEIAKSIRQLRQLKHPAPQLLTATARPPARPPAGVASAGVAVGSSHMACIIRAESGGRTDAVNGQYHGIGQWSPESWARNGGTQYASDPINATYEQQLKVLASEGDAGMSREQGQYDGCG
jgi:hypothetical protein